MNSLSTIRLLRSALCVFALTLAAGCVSQKKAQQEAREAYIRGQQQAMQAAIQAQQAANQQQGPIVYVRGQVVHPQVPWEDGMKLSKVLWEAEYKGYMNPRMVRVLRNGQVVGELRGVDLVHHQDLDVENGDTVLIVP